MRNILIGALSLAALGCTQGAASSVQSAPAEAAQAPALLPLPETALESARREAGLMGLSVAVFDDYGSIRTATFGTKSSGGAAIATTTAFSTASVAKPFTAMLCLILEAEGLLDLDEPIAASLTRWKLPESDVEGAAGVTWRQLLSHTGGTSQHGFADFYEGDTLPTLVDSVEGRLPRYDKPIEFLFPPGQGWKYSGGGYTIIQIALEDRMGQPLHAMVQDRILTPLGMTNSTMIQPGQPGFPDDVALVHAADGSQIRDGRPITPQVSASGLWSTPRDLALYAIAIQRGLRGETTGPVTPQLARAMTDIWSLDHVGGMGTPFFRGFGYGNTEWFQHGGSNTGVNVDMYGAMEGGYGFVIMGNGDDPATDPVFAAARREIIASQRWAERKPLPSVPLEPEMRRAIMGDYTGLLYDLGLPYTVEEQGGRMMVVSPFFTQFLGRDSSEMHYQGGGAFRITDYPNLLTFELGDDGQVAAVTISRPGSDAKPLTRPIAALRK
ncbi:serine hydrolase domain-containing protein [Paraurantiacibacter namhicola]|uniref:D-alanyl-D-alanine carboxypeptidase n=1 Tax=Paraurantiacibacter namhicola TaxID=645517 RepID=A0A1C7D5V7_9SPHN|nr:serine hydrolase domain-containing protein [Paraurantiacibacter namhicola]ANU06845.1 D-alanyl-D-alanine carboxypeptidase precursor [Paraurantiacibacter namhicola]